jgi:nitrite reductase/ring-hydroxylating ferredoxin subunit
MVQAPCSDRFAAYPASWYLFGSSREVREQPVSRDLLGRRLTAFRPASGGIVVLDAHCAHLGADLGRGRVVGDRVQCPFHHWEYGRDGQCEHIPAQSTVPPFARQVCYPAVERHGFIFIFNGRRPLFPVPYFFDTQAENYVAGRPFHFHASCSWFLLGANGFDMEHMAAVHDRTLTRQPVVDCPAPFARRIRYATRVTGSSIYDRLLRRTVGTDVEVAITNWGGTLTLVAARFPGAASHLMVVGQPLPDGTTAADVIVFARASHSLLARAMLDPLALSVRRWFTHGFVRDDLQRLAQMRYNPHTLIPADRLMIEFFDWAADLPQVAAADYSMAEQKEANGMAAWTPDHTAVSERRTP